MSPRSRNEDGSGALELVIVTPVLIALLLFVVGLGQLATASQDIEAVAADAARAASLERNTAASGAAAHTAAERSLADGGFNCTDLDVDVDVSDYRPGGRVTVKVACTAKLSQAAMTGLPGSRTFKATSTVPIETYRAS